MINETAYWIALAHLPGWETLKINSLIVKFHHENKISIEDFFQLTENVWRNNYRLDEQQISDLLHAKSELPSIAFLAESLLSQGFELIPITSTEYPKKLKENLKSAYSPSLLYVKGNKKIFEEKSIAIIGSQNASEIALKFTDHITKLAISENKTLISGFAKGVDKLALDSTIKYNGKSIIVLPQGIITFGSGFTEYYKQIIAGDVLVISTFFPRALRQPESAMAGNKIIDGLADEIIVAETAEQDATWLRVTAELNKGRKIFIRQPELFEKNANQLLIENGATPVDIKEKKHES